MTTPIAVGLLLAYITFVSLMAAWIAWIIKKAIKSTDEGSFKVIFTYALFAELAGFLVTFYLWYLHKQKTGSWSQAGAIMMIPMFAMLVGIIIGMFQQRSKDLKQQL